MAIYSIDDMEKLSGIKAHTLRIWEQRYGIVKPRRTASNVRYFDDEDLRHILNIALLNRHGFKISKIARMNSGAIQEKVAAIAEVNHEYATQLDALTLSVMEMDELKFDRIISNHIHQNGLEQTMLEVIYPFLEKLSLLWLSGSISPVQESFFTNLIRQKIIAAIEAMPLANFAGKKKFLLFLPQGERQELSLLFLHYLIRKRGLQSIYVGMDVEETDLPDLGRIIRPDFVFTMVTEAFSKTPLKPFVAALCAHFPNTKILLSGYQVIAQSIENTEQVTVVGSLQETLQFIENAAIEPAKAPVSASAK